MGNVQYLVDVIPSGACIVMQTGSTGRPPRSGDYAQGHDGQLYRVIDVGSNIYQGNPNGYLLTATVEPADWSDCPEGDEYPGYVEVR